MSLNMLKGFTHGGNFHADDVFSTAFLRILNPSFKVERGFEIPANYKGIVYDIGGGKYDHHGEIECRENGIPYASFGKLWREFSYLICNSDIAEAIDKNFISDLDLADCTGSYNALSYAIYSFNANWDEKCSVTASFNTAVDLAEPILKRIIEEYISKSKARDIVLYVYSQSNNGLVQLEQYLPWDSYLKGTDAKLVMYPSNRGGWNLEQVPGSECVIPKEWWGTRDKEIVKGLTFCHNTGFLCAFDTSENAYNAGLKLVRGESVSGN